MLAALGVSALIAASPTAFLALKICGGLYLIWLGIQALRSRGGVNLASAKGADDPLRKLSFKGLFANAINPKVVLFLFLAAVRSRRPWRRGLADRATGADLYLQAALLFGLLGYFPVPWGNG